MLNLPALKTREKPGIVGCYRITVPRSPCSLRSKSLKTIVGRGSITGPRSEL
jgi:hypothetical protein